MHLDKRHLIAARLTTIRRERLAHYRAELAQLFARACVAVGAERDQLAGELAAVLERIRTWRDPRTSATLAALAALS